MVLGKIKQIADDSTGSQLRDAVIAVPAHFGRARRQATKNADRMPGLNALSSVGEPTAADIAYGLGRCGKECPHF